MSSIPTQSSLLTHLPGFPVAVSDYVRLGFRSLYGCGAVRAFHPLPCIIRLYTCGLLRRWYVLIANTKGVLVGTLPPKLENRAVFRLRATYLPAFPVSQWLYRICPIGLSFSLRLRGSGGFSPRFLNAIQVSYNTVFLKKVKVNWLLCVGFG